MSVCYDKWNSFQRGKNCLWNKKTKMSQYLCVLFIIIQAPRPSTGPHKLRESLPLIVFLRNRLKYALTYDEVKKIVHQRLIKVDGKVRTDMTFPAGFMGKLLNLKYSLTFRLTNSWKSSLLIGLYIYLNYCRCQSTVIKLLY